MYVLLHDLRVCQRFSVHVTHKHYDVSVSNRSSYLQLNSAKGLRGFVKDVLHIYAVSGVLHCYAVCTFQWCVECSAVVVLKDDNITVIPLSHTLWSKSVNISTRPVLCVYQKYSKIAHICNPNMTNCSASYSSGYVRYCRYIKCTYTVHHRFLQLVHRLHHARSVRKDELIGLLSQNTENPMSRGLWLR